MSSSSESGKSAVSRVSSSSRPPQQGRVGPSLQPFPRPVEVDLPPDQLGREPHVLSVPADRERELILVHRMAVITCLSESEITFDTRAGASARRAKTSGSGCQGTMSIRSPPSSDTTAWNPGPLEPHAGADWIDRPSLPGPDRESSCDPRPPGRALGSPQSPGRSPGPRDGTAPRQRGDHPWRGSVAGPWGVSSTFFRTARMGSP